MSATGILITAGARTRWANLVAGGVMLLVILLIPGVANLIAMPALGRASDRRGHPDLPPARGGDGVANGARSRTRDGSDLRPHHRRAHSSSRYWPGSGCRWRSLWSGSRTRSWSIGGCSHREMPFPKEVPPPRELPAGEVVVLTTYGSLFFASAPVFESQLPKVTDQSQNAVVVLRLRGKEDLGSTFITVLDALPSVARVGGVASGALRASETAILRQLRDTGSLEELGAANVFTATASVGESLQRALVRADQLQAGRTTDPL